MENVQDAATSFFHSTDMISSATVTHDCCLIEVIIGSKETLWWEDKQVVDFLTLVGAENVQNLVCSVFAACKYSLVQVFVESKYGDKTSASDFKSEDEKVARSTCLLLAVIDFQNRDEIHMECTYTYMYVLYKDLIPRTLAQMSEEKSRQKSFIR